MSQYSSQEGPRSRETTRTAADMLAEERGGTSMARDRQDKAHRHQDPHDHMSGVYRKKKKKKICMHGFSSQVWRLREERGSKKANKTEQKPPVRPSPQC